MVIGLAAVLSCAVSWCHYPSFSFTKSKSVVDLVLLFSFDMFKGNLVVVFGV